MSVRQVRKTCTNLLGAGIPIPNQQLRWKNKIQLSEITFKLRKSSIVTDSWCLLQINEDEK